MNNEQLEIYLKEINKAYGRGDSTEHTHRGALARLVEGLGKKITAINEPKRIECGAPDILVVRQGKKTDLNIGYIETKDIGTNLTQAAKSEQIKKRYLPSLPSLILTDYIEFRWYIEGELKETVRLAEEGKGGLYVATEESKGKVGELLELFLGHEPEGISNARKLTERMASMARLMREVIEKTFKQEAEKGSLHQQMEAFREVLLHDLTEEQFADMYAQTITYGLFTAICNVKNPREFTREHAAYDMPKTNPFLRKMFGHIAGPDLDERIAWLLDELIILLRNADMGVILRDFARQKERKDPVVHFYETFLAAYDTKMREMRGVYYTPEAVVSYIVRSVDYLLRTRFGLKKGLADETIIEVPVRRGDEDAGQRPAVQSADETSAIRDAGGTPALHGDGASALQKMHKCLILDPAVGTGTFLHEVIEQIYGRFKRQKGKWSSYVAEHLLPRIFGFELLMAPYAVAHMKLGLQLANTGYDFQTDERLGIYLTNTLEEAEETSRTLFAQWLSEEATKANRVKMDLPIMVVLGNPPYSGLSANMNEWIDQLLKNKLPGENGAQSYYEIDGRPLGEKKVWLQDDYVKFIRFGQLRIEQSGYGILAFINNHSYLDNPTFRGMRQSLMQTFDEIYVLDMHGNSKKKETCLDGSPDKNVFDIQQGVSIGIFVKRKDKGASAKIYHADLYGLRKGKYEWLIKNEIKNTDWTKLSPNSPYYFFVKRDESARKEYEMGWRINEVLPENNVGIVTARDSLTIHLTSDDVWTTVNDFTSIPSEEARRKYSLGKDVQSWKVHLAQADLNILLLSKDKITPILYRPFDIRYTYYTGKSGGFICRPIYKLMRHILEGENLGLVTTRQQSQQGVSWALVGITKHIIESCAISNKTREINYLFPLYLYPKTEDDDLFERSEWPAGKNGRIPNLSVEFVEEFSGRLGLEFVSDGCGDLGEGRGKEAGGTPAVQDAGGTPALQGADGKAVEQDADGTEALKNAGETPAVRGAGGTPALHGDGTSAVRGATRGVHIRDRGYLPHWTAKGAVYHVTFRMYDALPAKEIEEIKQEREAIIQRAQQAQRELTEHERKRLQKLYSDKIERYLDSGKGKCYLANAEIAEMLMSALGHFDGERYELYSWCIMPNHVHVILKPLGDYKLSKILHSWKSYSAHEANKILERKGPFWSEEYYDHLIRDENEFYQTMEYIRENPLKAGLVEWPWIFQKSVAGVSPAEGEDADETSALQGTFGPEDVLHYIYAVFHAPGYRKRYSEFLKIDFPRVPLTSDKKLFRRLCKMGRELVGLHLLESEVLEEEEGKQPSYPVEGEGVVEKGYPKYILKIKDQKAKKEESKHAHEDVGMAPAAPQNKKEEDADGTSALRNKGDSPSRGEDADETSALRNKGDSPSRGEDADETSALQRGRVYINQDQYFEGVRVEVWEFCVGGYQVCEKWLKDRRGRRLSYEDISHYQKVVAALGETIRLMGKIDAAIGEWPIR